MEIRNTKLLLEASEDDGQVEQNRKFILIGLAPSSAAAHDAVTEVERRRPKGVRSPRSL